MTLTTPYIYGEVLDSARLTCRFLKPEDAIAWVPFFEDAESVAGLPDVGQPSAFATAAFWIDRQMARYREHRYGLQALLLKESGEMVGMCGLLLQEIEGKPELEVGYHMLAAHRGNGYAPEAAAFFIDFAFRNNQSQTVVSVIEVNNINSQKVAEKNGLVREKRISYAGMEVYIYRITKESWAMKADSTPSANYHGTDLR